MNRLNRVQELELVLNCLYERNGFFSFGEQADDLPMSVCVCVSVCLCVCVCENLMRME